MLEVLREGWLTKSPPDWKFWNSKWKPRYFVLIADHSAGECSLKYYVDQEKTKLRGSINLDECIQVDANLTFDYKNRIRYQWIFDIRIPKRVYYLVATSEDDMNAWVNDLCCVCNLQRDQDPDYSETTATASENDVLCADPHNWKRSRPAQSANKKLTDREPWCNGNEGGQLRTKISQSNGFQRGRTVQGYIPLTDCISGPPRPKQSQHSIKSSEIPPKHPPPPLPAELAFRKTSENFKDNVSFPSSTQEASIGQDNSSCAYNQSEKPPPRPPKRGVQSVGNVYENEVNNDNAAPVFPFYDNPLPPFSLFSSLPRPVKVKTGASSQTTTLKNGSTFGTVPRIPREKKTSLSPVDRTDRTSSSAMAGLSSLSDLSISSSGTGSSSINASTGASPPPAQTDYYCFGVKSQDEPTIADRGVEAKPPEVRRELKPGRLTSSQVNFKQAQAVPSSLDVQPYLPYRLSREPGGSKAVVKPHPDGPSLDLSRKISFSKKRAALQEAAKVMPKTTYASVVNVPALRDCSARLLSLSETETEDPVKGSNDSIHQMEYVEVGKTAQISPSPSPVPPPVGVQQQVGTTGPPKTSYVVISQEKTQALMKTKSEQDHMYKTGTLERNKLGAVMTAPPKKL